MRSEWIRFTRILAVANLLIVGTTISTGAEEPVQANSQTHQLTEQLESLAEELSIYVAVPESRTYLSSQVGANYKSNAVILSEFLASANAQGVGNVDERVFELATSVQETELTMTEMGFSIPRLDLLLPLESSRDLLEDAEEIYVAVDPLMDEREVVSITAYSNGEILTLSPDEPPEVPTFVIGPAESESLDPTYPLEELDEPMDEASPERIVDDFVGISHIRITDVHEPWYKGDPEIYVFIRWWLVPSGAFGQVTRDLDGVNSANRWYYLGDPNPTYRYLDDDNDRFIEVIIYEADDGDSDDVVGVFIPDWRALSFSGYTDGVPKGSTQHARIQLDRD